MASRKGKGPAKGKQPAKKQPAKRPPPAVSSSDDEDDVSFHAAILKRLEALERGKGAPVTAGSSTERSRPVRAASKAAFRREILTRLSALESKAGSAEAGPATARELPAEEDVVACDPEPEGQVDAGQVAVAVEPSGPDGAASNRERKRILIAGHSMVFWAAVQARRTPIGAQLGLSEDASIEWLGRRGLRWSGLLHLLFGGRTGPPPHILVLHVGGNDLGLLKGRALSLQVIADLRVIKSHWPDVYIFWSEMLPRRKWREYLDPRGMARARRRANRAIQKALVTGLGIYLPHPRIKAANAALYRADGVHLSPSGNDIFLDDLRLGLRLALGHLWGARA
ncbi:uncharacterized protein LOC129332380 isoform X2 [Eublepharis macularius]|uniref:Uncharacterized protein LOC129332380 isoform X2 n=1 Tax=Eublepharis macularius TaxID=481883 RepID=A0AA97JJM8_EUBMA|nr:uncharacterized protein LOC129332380 isoform X2 [Eublepharis macularius]